MSKLSKEDSSLLRRIFFRSCTLEASFNYEKLQALGFSYAMLPALKKYYSGQNQQNEQSKALVRSLSLFNMTPAIAPFVMGLTASLEKERSNNPQMDEAMVSNLKTSLMGPLSGIGDSFFWGTFRIIAVGIGLSLSQAGSILGPLMFLLLFNIPNLGMRWFGLKWGFTLGTSIIDKMSQGQLMQRISKIFGIVGLMCVGSMTATMVSLNLGLQFSLSGAVVNLQSILDQILPNLLPLAATLYCYKLINKGISVNKLLFGVILFGIVGKAIGLL